MPNPKREKDVLSVLGRDVQSITRLAHELDKNLFNRINQRLLPLEISQTQALFILYLGYYTDLPAYQRALEKTFGLTNPTVTASIKSLVNKGIVRREQDPDDGRYFRLYLTDYGRSLYEPCIDAFLGVNAALEERLTKEEQMQFLKIMKKLLQ